MLSLVMLGGALTLALLIVLAWLVYSVSLLRTDAAYISELNKVIEHVNTISHGVQQAHARSTTRIEDTEVIATSAKTKGTATEVRVAALDGRVQTLATDTQRIDASATQAKTSADAAKLRVDQLDASLTARPTLDYVSQNYLLKAEFPDQSGYAKWADMKDRDVTTSSLDTKSLGLVSATNVNVKGSMKLDGADELVYCPQSGQCKKVQFAA